MKKDQELSNSFDPLPKCASCQKQNLFLGIDLGYLPISNELNREPGLIPELFPLQLLICPDCSLGQAPSGILPERLFSDYRYLSSVSSTFLAHAREFCDSLISNGTLTAGDLVLEIACNDGYLLQNLLNRGVRILGIEPSMNVGQVAYSLGIPVINEFFGSALASEIVTGHGYPRLVIANNVLAHVPNIRDFMKGLATLCGPSTLISIENPSILNILEDNQFDTIYHEHFSYLSCNSVDNLATEFGLSLFDLDRLETHGGSNRYWLTKQFITKTESLLQELEREKLSGLFEKNLWKEAEYRKQNTLVEFKNWLTECRINGESVLGYGAAAKASTLLNAARVDIDLLAKICDLSDEKVDRFMPAADFKIISYSDFVECKPDNVVIFPWNIAKEISKQILADCPDTKIWIAVPNLTRIN
jgi:hypothetical protein